MSDNLFQDEEQKQEYEYEEGDKGLAEKLVEKLGSAKNLVSKSKEEQEDIDNKNKVSLIDDKNEEKESLIDQLDRFTVLVVLIEFILLIYFILALLDFVPFF